MISETPPLIPYTYIGPGNYTFPFTIRRTEHLRVELEINGNILILSSSYYTVNWDPAVQGGSIDTTYPLPAEGGILTIKRILPISQPEPWGYNSVFSTALLESSLDNIVMIIQQLSAEFTASKVVTNWRQDWVSGVAYSLGDFVFYNGDIYLCLVAHTSNTFAIELAELKWTLIFAVQSSLDLYDQVLAAVTQAEAAVEAAEAAAAAAAASILVMPTGIELVGGIIGFECAPALDEDHDVTISPGACLNSTGELGIKRAASMVKRLYGYWIEGDSQNGLLNGQVSPVTLNTLYHLYALLKNDGSVDFGWLEDGENISDYLPTSYVGWRWLRYHLVDVNTHIIRTTQNGDFIQHHKGSDWIVAVDVPTTPTAYDHSAFLPVDRVKSIKYGSRVNAGSSSAYISAVDEDNNTLFVTGVYAPAPDTSSSSWGYTPRAWLVPFDNNRLFKASSSSYSYRLLIHQLELKR